MPASVIYVAAVVALFRESTKRVAVAAGVALFVTSVFTIVLAVGEGVIVPGGIFGASEAIRNFLVAEGRLL